MAILSKYQRSLLGLTLSNATKNLVSQGMNTKQIIATLVDRGYRAAESTIAALANFWRAGDRASDYLNQKNPSSAVFTKSVPMRSNRPKLIRVSFTMKTTFKDRS